MISSTDFFNKIFCFRNVLMSKVIFIFRELKDVTKTFTLYNQDRREVLCLPFSQINTKFIKKLDLV